MDAHDAELTFDNVELTVGGMLYVADPPGSYLIAPAHRPLFVTDLLPVALDRCGLGDRLQDVYQAMRAVAEPRFAQRIDELESARKKATHNP